jgi:putative Holliday junction resolvase
VRVNEIWNFLDDYLVKEDVELVLVGYPMQLNNEPSEAIHYINPFLKKFQSKFNKLPIKLVDERFTSKLAFQAMIDAGVKKNDRRNKEMIDSVSATIILQSHLEGLKYLK